MANKHCQNCGEFKHLSEYSQYTSGKLNAWCQDCEKAANRARYVRGGERRQIAGPERRAQL